MSDGRLENELKERPSYDALYEKHPAAFGGPDGAPESFVVEVTKLLSGGRAFEVGAGQGRNALWLARQGFEVEATDLSEVGVVQMNARAQEEGVRLSARIADAREELSDAYDILVCTYLLHHLPAADALAVIKNVQAHTRRGGCNVIAAFTTVGDFHAARPDTPYWYAAPGELKSLYKDWHIVRYEESRKKALATGPQGEPLFNTVARILATNPHD